MYNDWFRNGILRTTLPDHPTNRFILLIIINNNVEYCIVKHALEYYDELYHRYFCLTFLQHYKVISPRQRCYCVLGWYWIDPNLGMPYDAVYVYCNMSNGGETCVFPDIHSSQMPNIPWRKEGDKTDWYSNLRGGFKVRYYWNTII